jgi:cell wall-associated NlpC family hydrolase
MASLLSNRRFLAPAGASELFSVRPCQRGDDPALPVHVSPQTSASIDTHALTGECVRVFRISHDGWAHVQLCADGYVGFVRSSKLIPFSPSSAPNFRVQGVLSTPLYPSESIKFPPLGSLPFGAAVHVISEQGKFAVLQILDEFNQSRNVFVWRAHLVPIDQKVSDWVSCAELFEGVPYLWAGKTSSAGIDCSGLVQVCCAAAGIQLPRDTDVMEASLGAVASGDSELFSSAPWPSVQLHYSVLKLSVDAPLERGDIVFWRGHVASMVDSVRCIHANGNAMRVSIEPLAVVRQRALDEPNGSDISSIFRIKPL